LLKAAVAPAATSLGDDAGGGEAGGLLDDDGYATFTALLVAR